MNKTLVPCLTCGGTGLVERPVQEAASHGEWVAHMFKEELCSKCNGGGKLPLDYATVKEA